MKPGDCVVLMFRGANIRMSVEELFERDGREYARAECECCEKKVTTATIPCDGGPVFVDSPVARGWLDADVSAMTSFAEAAGGEP